MTAAAVLGIGRTRGYEMARHGEFPVRVIRIGATYRVPVADLLTLLGISEAPPATAEAREPRSAPTRPLSRTESAMRARHLLTLPGAAVTPAAAADPARARRDLLIWGAHGGSGTTTLATLLSPARDMGVLRTPADYQYPAPNASASPVAVTCRCTTWSALKASAAVTALTRTGGQVNVLIVVSDGWPEPPIATAWFRLLSVQVGAVVRVPFVPWLRLCNDPVLARLPRPARQALTQIRSITGLTEGQADAAPARAAHPA